ncbi:Secreted subtilisin-like serine protease sub11 [Mortierella alpina]|nr:Secreted subtilisin-like serine protease sub11 [Mortierella alpina]
MKSIIIIAALLAIAQESMGELIPNRYMVRLSPSISVATFKDNFDTMTRFNPGLDIKFDLDFSFTIFNGFSAILSPDAFSKILTFPGVEEIEQESVVLAYDIQENPPSWGLSRISEIARGNSSRYVYDKAAGEGITVYVVDSGVNALHEDLEGKVRPGFSCRGMVSATEDMDTSDDLNGHGTHVAAIVAGDKYGVAKRASIVSVKVLKRDGKGVPGCMVSALEWIKKNAIPGKSVVNISVGNDKMNLTNQAVDELVKANIPVIVAAGNQRLPACNFSPASASGAYAVGCITDADKVETNSNTGKCVKIFAPGANILSAETACSGNAIPEDTKCKENVKTSASLKRTGTSMASPHVAGVAAILLSGQNLPAQALYDKITSTATTGKIIGLPNDTPNRILYSGKV